MRKTIELNNFRRNFLTILQHDGAHKSTLCKKRGTGSGDSLIQSAKRHKPAKGSNKKGEEASNVPFTASAVTPDFSQT